MNSLAILVVTRNRLDALIDALQSLRRLKSLIGDDQVFHVYIQDNSDIECPPFIINYFSKYMKLTYRKTTKVLAMSKNWNEGLKSVAQSKCDYVCVLADRRLVTRNLAKAVEFAKTRSLPFLCFDHQSVWLNSSSVIKRNHSHNHIRIDQDSLLKAISSACINWHHPMLFNCVINREFLNNLFANYGTYADGASPDINFLARIADLNIDEYWCYDSPCIITNARHASRSNGSSALKSGTIDQTEHTILSGIEAYPIYMDNFVTANILGSLKRYWSEERIRCLLDPINFFNSSLLEYSYPKSLSAYRKMTQSLEMFVKDFSLDKKYLDLLHSIPHQPSHLQSHPINWDPCILNSPNFIT